MEAHTMSQQQPDSTRPKPRQATTRSKTPPSNGSQPPEKAPARPTPDDHERWKTYWEKRQQPWRTESEIDASRQEELAKRRAIVPDIEKGIYPFSGIKLNRADIEWLLATHENGRGPVDWDDKSQRGRVGLDLRGANLGGVDLRDLPLAGLRGGLSEKDSWKPTAKQEIKAAANLEGAILTKAQLQGAIFIRARMQDVDLSRAQMQDVNLSWVQMQNAFCFGANLENATLHNAQLQGALLSEAQLQCAHLHNVDLRKANLNVAQLQGATLAWAQMQNAFLPGANLKGANLTEAQLQGANFSMTCLQEAYLGKADLQDTNLSMARLQGADLSEANLNKARLEDIVLVYQKNEDYDKLQSREGASDGFSGKKNIDKIGPRLADVHWGDANLSVIDWPQIIMLGDEYKAQQKKDLHGMKYPTTRLREYQRAVRANRQLAVALQAQGLNEEAARFAYRANVLQRKVLWFQMSQPKASLRQRGRKLSAWVFSHLLNLVAGYGYKPERSLLAYLLVIFGFMGLYLLTSHFTTPHLRWDEALVLSLSSFHGRGFFSQTITLGDAYARLAVTEAVLGLFIEISFIATFTQRFFGR
jgi:uncharacterized protein YjbI with pentapeptide repeats